MSPADDSQVSKPRRSGGDIVVDSLFLPVALVNPEGICVRANPAFGELFDVVAGEPVATLLRLAATHELTSQLRDVFDHGLEWHDLVLELETRAAGKRSFSAHTKRLEPSESGEEYLALLVLQDITERAQAQRQVLALQRLESVGRLAAGVAHDFNNLLTIIQTCIGFVGARLEKSDPAYEDVAAIREAADRASKLSGQLLAFSRRSENLLEVVDLNREIAALNKLLERVLGEDVELATDLAVDLHKVLADRSHIEQIIVNLAVNARDAMPDGGRLSIETLNVGISARSARPDLPAGSYVRLTVSDSGQGMDEATLARAFEPFFTTKRPDKGTGLGLSTVQTLVEEHRGRIYVDSESGRGTSFSIFLPQTRSSEDSATQPVRVRPRSGTETVLLVDDETALRRAARRILESGGYAVIEASDAAAALAECEKVQRIDILLTDLEMPGINGQELARQVIASWPRVRVLFMSGYPGESIARTGKLDRGLYVQKPFSADRLLRAVRDSLDVALPSES